LSAEYTKSLNELSDYGDALKRFKNHLTNPIEPAVLFSLMHSNKGQRPMFTSGFGHSILSPQEPHTSPVMTSYDKSPDKRKTIAFWGFEGFKCRNCGIIILGFVYDIPPLRRATESTTSKCSLAGYPDQLNQLERPRPYQENLFTHLTRCITSSLGERLYLYCREVIASQNYNEFFKSQRALESILGIPDKFNRIKLGSISSGHWAMRSKKEGRTLLLPNELEAFLQMAYASYALVHITIDGRSGYYFMWIDGEKPYFQLQSENILQRMLSGDDSNLIAY
jgi:hypothetical protein